MTPALEQIKALPAKWRAEATELRRNAIAARANGAATVDAFARADRLDAKADGLHEAAQALDTALQALRDEAGEAIHPDTKRRLLQEAADYDKGEEFAKAKAIGIRSAIEQIEQQHRLIRPAPAAPASDEAGEAVGKPAAWLYLFPHDGETDHALSLSRFLPSWIAAKGATETPLCAAPPSPAKEG